MFFWLMNKKIILCYALLTICLYLFGCCSHSEWGVEFCVWLLLCDVMHCLFYNHLAGEGRVDSFPLIMLLLSHSRLCSVSLPRKAIDWSVLVSFPGHTYYFHTLSCSCEPPSVC